MDWVLGLDFGTCFTTGAIVSGGRVDMLRIQNEEQVPSVALVDDEGVLVVGANAEAQAHIYRDRFVRATKRYVEIGVLPVAGIDVRVPEVIAPLYRQFLEEGMRRHDQVPPRRVVLSHPAVWGEGSIGRRTLVEAAGTAGLVDPALVAEPVAAAVHHVGDTVDVGEFVAVYDLGGGTFDAAVLQRTSDGYEVAGPPGGAEVGGEDFDFELYRFFGDLLAKDAPEIWEALRSDSFEWQDRNRILLEDVRFAKLILSLEMRARVKVPGTQTTLQVTRGEFEDLIRPVIEDTANKLDDVIRASAAGGLDRIKAIFLVGGSSRIPLVGQVLRERFGPERIRGRDEPKNVVAKGAAQWLPLPEPGAAGGTPSPPAGPPGLTREPAQPATGETAVAQPPPATPAPMAPTVDVSLAMLPLFDQLGGYLGFGANDRIWACDGTSVRVWHRMGGVPSLVSANLPADLLARTGDSMALHRVRANDLVAVVDDSGRVSSAVSTSAVLVAGEVPVFVPAMCASTDGRQLVVICHYAGVAPHVFLFRRDWRGRFSLVAAVPVPQPDLHAAAVESPLVGEAHLDAGSRWRLRGQVTAVALSPAATVVAVGRGDGSVCLLELSTKRWQEMAGLHSGAVTGLAWLPAPGAPVLVTGGADGTVRRIALAPGPGGWPLAAGAQWEAQAPGAVGAVAVLGTVLDASGRALAGTSRVLAGDTWGQVHLLHPETGEFLYTAPPPRPDAGAATQIVVSADGGLVLWTTAPHEAAWQPAARTGWAARVSVGR